MATLRRLDRPENDAVSVADASAHVLPREGDEQLLANLVRAATELVETKSRRTLAATRWRLTLDGFPSWDGSLVLPQPPAQSVEAIRYVDTSGADQTLDAAAYTLHSDGEPGLVYPVDPWPTVHGTRDTVLVDFTAGYATAAEVPEAARQAVLLMVGHWYENREAVVVGPTASKLPMAVESLVASIAWGGYS